MTQNKPYLDANLTLKDLASLLNVSSNHLSQIINQFAKKNFYTYINEYRIREAAILLKNPAYENYTILTIAYDAGFKSKSVFNALFKKYYNKTPSIYKKEAS